ncbi:FRG domain-containing protein [Bacillus cereus]|uniref:FRG domain-containing protein n=1 Tax=Bacillus cereus TaxID=1396 RepID=UPI0024536A32|nr:FRG domain-containing protein [Bacillus cereus]MDH4419954.1 FRG domain-containing protein [Bacillus cereus]
MESSSIKEIPKKQEMFSKKWHNILEEIALFRRKSMANWIWFRGHANEDYKLDSGLFRVLFRGEKLDLDEYLNIERRLIINFKNQSTTFIRENDIDIQFHMQHHGLKTRLLDWTDSFGTALYFAFEGWDYDKNNNACIWLLDPHALTKYLYDDPVIFTPDSFGDMNDESFADVFEDIRYSFPMYPSKNNARLLAQNGYFTVQSNSLEDLETELDQVCPDDKDKILKKIILSPDLIENIYEYLTLNGINRFTVFNDIDGLCYYLNKELTENAYNDRLLSIAKFRNYDFKE